MEPYSRTRVSLLLRLRDPRDDAAWLEFDRRYGPLILAYCRASGFQPTDAEDVRQLVMTKLSTRIRTFEYHKELGGFRRYLRTVTRGEMARHVATAGGRDAHQLIDDSIFSDQSTDIETDAAWEREWMRHHFRIAWETVKKHSDEKSLEVFKQILAGVSPGLIAEATGMTEPAVRKVKQRVCERLKTAIAEQILDEEDEQPPGR